MLRLSLKNTHQILQFRCDNVKKTPNRKIKPGGTVNVEVLIIHSITKDVLIALKRRKKKLEKKYIDFYLKNLKEFNMIKQKSTYIKVSLLFQCELIYYYILQI